MIQNGVVEKRLSFKTKFYYGIASFGKSLVSSVFAALLPIFYQDYLGLSARWIGIASVIYAVWNAINDPLFGHITDNTHSRLGRRIPYLRFTAPFLCLTFILVWFAPQGAGDVRLFWSMLIAMLLYDTCYTIAGLVHGALMPELSESDLERNELAISSSIFGLIGYVFGFLLPDLFRPQSGSQDTSLLTLQLSMVAVGVTAMFLIILTTFNIKERREFAIIDKPIKLWASLRYTLTSKPFWVFVSMNFLLTFMQLLATGSNFYLGDYVTKTRTIVLLVYLFAPLGLAIPVARPMVKRFGILRAQQIYLLIGGIGLVSLTFLPVKLIPIGLILAGLGLSGQQTITYNLLAQVIEDDEVRTGARREGAYYGANALLTKPAQSLSLLLTAFLLEQSGFITRAMNNGEVFLNQAGSALFGIRTIVGLIPGLSMLIGAGILLSFPLMGERLARLKETILSMHVDKASQLKQLEGE
jgi:GPH family glycoside/pentoside/hexuronide:cation symporter